MKPGGSCRAVGLSAVFLLCGLAAAASARAEGFDIDDVDFSGFVAGELRIFPEDAQFPEQDDSHASPSLILQPEFRYRWNRRDDRITFIPFLRLDPDDQNRTHADIRELSWYHAEDDWDTMVGISKVFWGVAESRHLVDIINQTDLVESPDQEDKLGQPMLNLNLLQDWGTLSFFVLPGFRERTFPDDDARLRGGLPISSSPSYESSLEEWHVDFAARYSHSFGNWDIGIAQFYGTSREPRLIAGLRSDGSAFLRPRYDIINQTSIDAQFTTGPWLLKLEALTRDGHDDDRFFSAVGGFEYTLFGIFESNADLGLLAEYLHDGSSDDTRSPGTPFEDDVFLGTRLALNDVEDTELLAGVIMDVDDHERIFSLEFERRLNDNMSLEIEGQLFDNIESDTLLNGFKDDSFLEVRLSWFF